mmetsp:Transcript_50347/g.99136  ORF Transcript_50347/g.99136 Transcript_50347/m.99136 type:complete len:253 (+) Transcript_50347:900-1658(+)
MVTHNDSLNSVAPQDSIESLWRARSKIHTHIRLTGPPVSCLLFEELQGLLSEGILSISNPDDLSVIHNECVSVGAHTHQLLCQVQNLPGRLGKVAVSVCDHGDLAVRHLPVSSPGLEDKGVVGGSAVDVLHTQGCELIRVGEVSGKVLLGAGGGESSRDGKDDSLLALKDVSEVHLLAPDGDACGGNRTADCEGHGERGEGARTSESSGERKRGGARDRSETFSDAGKTDQCKGEKLHLFCTARQIEFRYQM